jgi:tetratricopeptide (TPR) repeat protein
VSLYEEALKRRRATVGPDHAETLTSMNNLAALLWLLKKLDQSIPLFEETLAGCRRVQGKDHPDTLATMANLGVNYRDAGRLAEAIPLLEQAHARGRGHASLHWVRGALLETYIRAGKKDEGVALLDERLRSARRRWPADNLQRADELGAAAFTLLRLRAWAEAEPVLRECLAIRAKKLPDHWMTFYTRFVLGTALLGRKKYADAEPLLRQGYRGMRERAARVPPQGQVRLTEALERLVQLCDAMGRPDQAEAWRKELAATKAVAKAPKPK